MRGIADIRRVKADAISLSHISLRVVNFGKNTHKSPSVNINMSAIFWPTGKCSFQIFGKGNTQIDAFVRMFITASAIVKPLKLKHFLSFVQNALIGVQINIAIKNVIVTQSDIKIMCAYTMRMNRSPTKIRLYRKRMESFIVASERI